MTTSEPTTGEMIERLRIAIDQGTERVVIPSAGVKMIADRLESQERELSGIAGELKAVTARAERERDAAHASYPWVRIEGHDYFVQVKRFDQADNMVVIADHKFGWNSVRYEQIREWRGLPQEGEGL